MKRLLTTLICLAICIAPPLLAKNADYDALVAAAGGQASNQYLIELSGAGPGDLAAAVAAAGGTLVHDFSDIGSASAISDDEGFAERLKRAQGIKRVTRDLYVSWLPETSDFDVHDADVGQAGHVTDPNTAVFRPCQWNLDQINVNGAWSQGHFGAGTVVAVLDSGVSGDSSFGAPHIDLDGQVVGNVTMVSVDDPFCLAFGAVDSVSPLDFRFHGTFVAGQIAAHGFGIAGVAPDAKIYGVKVLRCTGAGSFADVIAGIIHAANQPAVDVINMSLGAYFPKNLPGAGPLLAAVTKAVNYAQGVQGKLVVSAAGNNGADLDHDGNFVSLPAQAGSGLSAWAGDIDGGLAGYSNHGVSGAQVGAGGGDNTPGSPNVPIPGCILAPGSHDGIASVCSVDSIFFGCGFGSFLQNGSGTSFAGPAVAAVGALAKGANPALNGNKLKATLKNTADDIGPNGTDNSFGHGRVNADSAVQ